MDLIPPRFARKPVSEEELAPLAPRPLSKRTEAPSTPPSCQRGAGGRRLTQIKRREIISLFLFSVSSPGTERDPEKYSEQQRQEDERQDGLAAARVGSGAQTMRRSQDCREGAPEEASSCRGTLLRLRESRCRAEDSLLLLFWNRLVYLCAISLP